MTLPACRRRRPGPPVPCAVRSPVESRIDRLYSARLVCAAVAAGGGDRRVHPGHMRAALARPLHDLLPHPPIEPGDLVARLPGPSPVARMLHPSPSGIPTSPVASATYVCYAQYLAAFEAAGRREGVLFIGRAQEKNTVFRTEKRRAADGSSYPWIVRTTSVVNQFYVHCVDEDFGAFFIKFSSYFPYGARLLVNGHHYAQAQAARAGIGFTALDNGFAACDDVPALQAICDSLDRGQDRGAGPQVAGHPALPVLRRRPGRRVPLRHLRLAGRVLPHPGAGQAGLRADLLRPGHP